LISLFAKTPKMFAASCRELQAGSLRSPESLIAAARFYVERKPAASLSCIGIKRATK
jgi:hypothetical protein